MAPPIPLESVKTPLSFRHFRAIHAELRTLRNIVVLLDISQRYGRATVASTAFRRRTS
jgi:hypothetical protein